MVVAQYKVNGRRAGSVRPRVNGRPGGAAAFAPSSIADLSLWLKPGEGEDYQDAPGTTPATADGHTVVRRNSLVGSAYATAAAGAGILKLNQLNGHATIRHDDSTTSGWTLNNFSLSNGQAWTLAIAAKCAARGLANGGSGCSIVQAGGGNFYSTIQCGFTCNHGTAPAWCAGDQEVLILKSTDAGVLWRQNGVATGTTDALASGVPGGGKSLFGLIDAAGAWMWIGDDYEALWYDRVLTDPEIEQVEAYLLAAYPPYVPSVALPSVFFLGDSIGAGANASRNALAWPELSISTLGAGYDRLNQAQSGTATQQWIDTLFALRITPYYSASYPKFIVFVFHGSNDINAGLTAAQIRTNFISIGNTAKALGSNVRVIFSTVITRDANTAPQNVIKDELRDLLLTDFDVATANPNVWLKDASTTWGDGLADFGNLSVSRADGTHPDDAGNATMAALAAVAIPLV